MDSPVNALKNWAKWTFSFSNNREAWRERICLFSLVLLSVLLFAFYGAIPGPLKLILSLVMVFLFAYAARNGALRLFGPVLAYDMLRIGRRRLNFTLRTSYALLLGFMLAWMYYFTTARFAHSADGLIPPKEQAWIGETVFISFMVIQFVLLALLTPGYVAGAISEEKERKTLEFLLATDLRNREIIFGKFVSRIANLLFYLLAGLPVLSLIQLFGGIDPEFLLLTYALTLMTILSEASVSMAASTMTRRARDAIALSYLSIIAYLALTGVAQLLRALSWAGTPLELAGFKLTLVDFLDFISAGNIGYDVALLSTRMIGPGIISFNDLARGYVIFHLFVIVFCLGYSVLRLRSIALNQLFGRIGGGSNRALTRQERRASRRRAVGNYPMIWKETFYERMKLSIVGRIFILLLGLACLLPPILLIFAEWDNRYQNFFEYIVSPRIWSELPRFSHEYVGIIGPIVCSFFFLGIAVRAANCIRNEKDQQTLDDLLTTSLTTWEILFGKWFGCVFSMRLGWYWLFGIWIFGWLSFGITFLTLLLLAVSTVIYASAFAWIGICCSLTCSTSLRATMWSICGSIFCGGGYLIVFGFCCAMPLETVVDMRMQDLEWLLRLVTSFSPPWILHYFTFQEFSAQEMEGPMRAGESYFGYAGVGVLGWVALSFLLSRFCQSRFQEMTNRIPYTPEVPPAPPPLTAKRDVLETP
ncbi:ABC transporter permease subunit [Telmatocola sphagniphila]|uniref:ABC transporter permease subunit n=1 Tax=Telmatocola sphagniphila TaxID=1123043 RepID=A0A8E6EWX5_9BACT|nr:ABC transporter permease subunit [Telmatocola sphagniphila]QVL31043.1 ABC transporter permease subunit [Telmatocola sphagniphila]